MFARAAREVSTAGHGHLPSATILIEKWVTAAHKEMDLAGIGYGRWWNRN
jgi:hypothetical protein